MKFLIYGAILTVIYFIDYMWFAWILAAWSFKEFMLPMLVKWVKEEIETQN